MNAISPAPTWRLFGKTGDVPSASPIGDLPEPRDPYIHLRLHRATVITLMASLVLHLLILFAIPQPEMDPFGAAGEPGPMGAAAPPLQVSMAPPRSDTSLVTQLPSPSPSASTPRNKRAERTAPRRMTQSSTPAPPITAPPPPVAEPAADLDSFVKAQQARRRAAQGLPPLQSDEQIAAAEASARNARALSNLRTGTNGVFQMISINERNAAFSFHGWTTDVRSARREYIPVEIGNHPSIELAVVRKMIELIRRHYQGDFNWESQRLDRVVVLSARPRDTEGLEEFLIREFFASRQR